MHSDRLGGPVWIFLVFVMAITVALAVFVVIDATRRLRRCGPDERPWLIFYAVIQGLFLVLMGLAQLDVFPSIFAAIVAVLTPLVLIQSIAYLLRVVFPKHPERTPACELDVEPGDTPPQPPT